MLRLYKATGTLYVLSLRGTLPGLTTDYPVFLVDYWVEDLK